MEVEDQDYHAMASPPAHVLDLSTLSMWSMFTTTFFGLSGRPVRKDEPEPEAAGGDEEVQENRANQVLRDINIYSMIKCKA